MYQIVVTLVSGGYLEGVPYVMDLEEVQATVQRFLQAEGQGSFVIETVNGGWNYIPTRSIDYISIVPWTGSDTSGDEIVTIPIRRDRG